MYDTADKITRVGGATPTLNGTTRNKSVTLHAKTIDNARIPDQTRHTLLLKDLVEMRSAQNSIKNKLRKILFNADKGKKNGNLITVLVKLRYLLNGQVLAQSGTFSSCNCLLITFAFILVTDKQGIMPVDDFYRLLKEEGPLPLSDAQKARIKKLFVTLKNNTLPYSTVLKSLEFSG